MEMTNILIFAVLGAIAMFIVSGGLASMMDMEATSSVLGGGAAVGAAVGAGLGWLGGDSAKGVIPASIASVMKGGADTELKVGLPAF